MRIRRALIAFSVVSALPAAAWPAQTAVAEEGLRPVRVVRSLTGVHEWYVQTYAGYPVLGSYYTRHLDLAGNVVRIDDGRLAVRSLFVTVPRVAAAAARYAAGAPRADAEVVVVAGAPARLAWAVYRGNGTRTLVDAASGNVISRTDLRRFATGQGRVFDPSPVVTLRDETLTDQGDRDYPALQPAYIIRPLTRLDGSGFLKGEFADVKGTTSRASSESLEFLYDRSDPRFEQTMAYYNVTTAQEYIQSLGFTDVNNEPQDMKVDQFGGDNSFFYPKQDFIKLGKGGVDDAEDAEVTWHEYGHAIQESQVPGFGEGHDAGSIGEGFSDYWAATMSEPVSGGFDVPCIADWDSTSYTSAVPHCLRRTDLELTMADQTGRIHHDGQIWSRALWDIHRTLGRTTADTIILEAQFFFEPDTSFADAAGDTVFAAELLYGSAVAVQVRSAFEDRAIL